MNLPRGFIFFATLLGACAALRAQTFVWSGLGSSDESSDNFNWVGNSAPGGVSGFENLSFGISSRYTPLVATSSYNDLTFTAAQTYTFSGDGGPASLTLNGNVSLAANGSVTIDPTLSIAFGTGVHTTDIASGASLTVASGISGAGSLVKSGVGNLTLSGANSYTGGTTISGGILIAPTLADGGANSSVGASSNIAANLVLDGGTLRYTGTGGSTDRLFTVGPGGGVIDVSGTTAPLIFSSTGSVAFTVPNFSTTLQLTGTGLYTGLDPFVGDNGSGVTSVTKSGSGWWFLDAANTYTGPTTINGGVLGVGSVAFGTGIIANGGIPSALGASSNAAANLVINGGTLVLEGPGASTDRLFTVGTAGATLSDLVGYTLGDISFTNTGAIALAGTNTPRTLTLANNSTDATFTLNPSLGDNGTGATSLTKTGAGEWVLTAANTYTGVTNIAGGILFATTLADGGQASGIGAATNSAGNLILSGGAVLSFIGNVASTDRLFTLNAGGGGLDSSGTGALAFTNTGAIAIGTDAALHLLTLSGSSGAANTLAPSLADGTNGATALDKEDPGFWTLSAANTYTGGTTINNGRLIVTNASGSATGTGLVTINSPGEIYIGNGGTTGAISGDIFSNGSVVFDRGNAYTYAGSISGGGFVEKAGTGVTTWTGTNSFSGTTDVVIGTLADGVANTFSPNSFMAVDSGSSLHVNFAETVAGLEANVGSSTLVFANSAVLTINEANTNAFNGVISGAGSIVKAGTGETDFAGANTYTGGTSVTAGTLVAVNATGSATGTGNISVGSNGTLQIGVGTTGAVSGNISGSGNVAFARTDDTTYTGSLSGTLNMSKSGAGTLTLGAANPYTGHTDVTAGTLADGLAGAFSTSSQTTISSGATLDINHAETLRVLIGSGAVVFSNNSTLIYNADASYNFFGTVSGAGSLVQAGSGDAELDGANTYTGTTEVRFGSLGFNAPGSSLINANDVTVGNFSGNSGLLYMSAGATVSIRTGVIGNQTGSSGTLDVSGSGTSWTSSNYLYVGAAGTGVMNVGFGAAISSPNISIGNNTGGTGTLSVDGTDGPSTLTVANTLYIGGQGSGTFHLTGGATASDATGSIGNNVGGTGNASITDSGSIWTNTGTLLVGDAGYGNIDIQNGGKVTAVTSFLAYLSGATGTVQVDGDGSTWINSGNLTVGNSSVGEIVSTNNGNISDVNAVLGQNAAGNGLATIIQGGTWQNSGTLTVASAGTGNLDIASGGVVTNQQGLIAEVAGSNGTVHVLGAGSAWNSSGDLTVGAAGTGVLYADTGGTVSNVNGILGSVTGGSGTVTITDSGSSWNNSGYLYVGSHGTGNLNVLAGATVANTEGQLGSNAGVFGGALVDGSGSIWTNSTDLLVGVAGTGLLEVSNGGWVKVNNGTGLVTLGNLSGASGTIDIGGIQGNAPQVAGVIDAGTITTGAGLGAVQFNTTASKASPYYLTTDGTAEGAPVTIAGGTKVTNSGGYTVLAGANSYTGGTVITGGQLTAGSNNALGTGSVMLNGGALNVAVGTTLSNPISFGGLGNTLAGNGTFSTPISVGTGVTLSPGNSPGNLSFSSGLTLAPGGTLNIEVQAASGSPGTGYDLVSISGSPLDISATSVSPFSLKLISLNGGGTSGDVADFVNTNTYSWAIAISTAGITNFAANKFTIDTSAFTNNLGAGNFTLLQGVSGGNPALIVSFSSIPEPSTYALMALGLGGLGLSHWRRRRA